MPKWWYDNSKNQIEDGDTDEVIAKKLFNQRICANKKPYFFIYNYDSLMKEYKDYIQSYDSNCLCEFGISLDELLSLESPTEDQRQVIDYYYSRLPVNKETCLVNEICYAVEKAFTEPKKVKVPFDCSILKYGANYSNKERNAIMFFYNVYLKTLRDKIKSPYFNNDIDSTPINDQFKIKCSKFIPDEKVLCDILIDIGYTSEHSKSFIWDLFGDVIIDNLLSHTDGYGYAPIADPFGDIEYCGERFSMKKVKMKGEE